MAICTRYQLMLRHHCLIWCRFVSSLALLYGLALSDLAMKGLAISAPPCMRTRYSMSSNFSDYPPHLTVRTAKNLDTYTPQHAYNVVTFEPS